MIAKEDIEKLAELSRLSLSEEEKEALAGDIESILAYVSDIRDVPVSHGVNGREEIALPVLREDGTPHERGIWSGNLVEAFPRREGAFAKVKRILSIG